MKYTKKTNSSRKDDDLLEKMKDNVRNWFLYFKRNNFDYRYMMSVINKSTISEKEREQLRAIDKPDIEINYLNAYLDRLIGEFSHQTPSVSISEAEESGEANPSSVKTTEVVEAIVMNIMHNYDVYYKNNVIKSQCGGGFAAIKAETEYRNDDTHDQVIRLRDCDPTMCFYDVFAKTQSKSDGEFSGEIYPMPEKEFKRKYPDHAECFKSNSFAAADAFNWFYMSGNQKVALVCDYYCKEYKTHDLLLLSDGSSMKRADYNKEKKEWNSFAPIPEIISSRKVESYDVYRYIFCGDSIIKKEKLKYPKLPYYFVDGNSGYVYLGDSAEKVQYTKSYVKNAIGPQKLLNSAAQTVADNIQNIQRAKMLVEKEAVVDQKAWRNIHRITHLQWNSKAKDGRVLPKPEPIVNPSLPDSVMSTFSNAQNIMQNCQGSYDAQLGISDKQLSGVAIEKGATQNNAVAIPFSQNYMLSLTDAIDFCVKLIPALYPTGATVPVSDNEGNHGYIKINQIAENGDFDIRYPVINYRESDLDITVKPDYSFQLQKDRAINTFREMMSTSEAFKRIAESPKGTSAMLDNIDMRSIGKLKEAHEEMIEESKNNPPPPSPIEIEAQIKMQELQLKQQELQLKQQELQQKNQKEMLDSQIKHREIELEEIKLQQEKILELLELRQQNINSEVANARVAAEIETHNQDNIERIIEQDMKQQQQKLKTAEHILKHEDQQHRHAMDIAKHLNGKN